MHGAVACLMALGLDQLRREVQGIGSLNAIERHGIADMIKAMIDALLWNMKKPHLPVGL